jgi:hypothetical protein
MRSAVVLPQPDGPSSATSSPGCDVEVEPVEGVHRAVGAVQVEEESTAAALVMSLRG